MDGGGEPTEEGRQGDGGSFSGVRRKRISERDPMEGEMDGNSGGDRLCELGIDFDSGEWQGDDWRGISWKLMEFDDRGHVRE